MDTIDLLGSTLGLGFLAGIRLYATVFLIGMVVRFHLIALPSNLAHLSVFGNTWVLATAAAACAIEFMADKIPWVDSLWDSIHTFIRPLGAVLIGATALANEDPVTRMVIALLCGGVAFSGHSTKAATRLLVNHSPEPFSNIGLSLVGDLFLPAGLWIAIKHPIIALGSIVFFMILFIWFAPSIFRSLRVECVAIAALLKKYFTSPPKVQPPTCVRCSAGRGVKGLINSVGNLSLETEYLVFTTSRMFRKRVHRVSVHKVEGTRFYRGLLVDSLTLIANDCEQVFDVFKVHTALQPEWLRSMTKARADSPATSS
jgi:hypothetical protein